jgi:5'-methylthioadenosine phosphorylase
MTKLAILTEHTHAGQRHETAYGLSAPIAELETLLVGARDADPRATVRALRDLGATHLWLCESVASLSPLLEPGDWLVPDDFIDGTRGQQYTYFSEKAGGYIQQVPPFDPASRDALLRGLAAVTPRPFRRAVYVCVSNTRLETPAEAAFYARAGGHVAGSLLSPWLMLARELEMKTAVLTCVTRGGGEAGNAAPFDIFVPVLHRAHSSLEQL